MRAWMMLLAITACGAEPTSATPPPNVARDRFPARLHTRASWTTERPNHAPEHETVETTLRLLRAEGPRTIYDEKSSNGDDGVTFYGEGTGNLETVDHETRELEPFDPPPCFRRLRALE